MLTTTSLALSILLTFTQEETTRPEPPAPAAVEAPAPNEPVANEAVPNAEEPTREPESAPAPAPAATPRKRELSRITLRDGQVLHGMVVRRDARVVEVELATGGRVELPANQVLSVVAQRHAQLRANGEVWLEDPNRTRYLYAPSAMMLRQGEGYFSQKELFFTSFNYGLTDHITIQAGAVVPAWLVPGAFNFIGGFKVGGSVSDRLHLAAGAQALVLPGLDGLITGATVGLIFGTATYGTPDAHLSLGLGTPFVLAKGEDTFTRHYIVTLSGNVRMSQRLALVSENWLVPTLADASSTSLPMVNSLALRIFGDHWAVDLGGIRIPETTVIVPWLDFAYNFGV